jgi:hypothetical protein
VELIAIGGTDDREDIIHQIQVSSPQEGLDEGLALTTYFLTASSLHKSLDRIGYHRIPSHQSSNHVLSSLGLRFTSAQIRFIFHKEGVKRIEPDAAF